jgi:hypothetical protein
MTEAQANAPTPKESERADEWSKPSPGLSQLDLFALTISADTGEIVKVEKVEGSGARRDLRDDDTMGLSAKAALTLDALIEQAFEAGIACMLGVRNRSADAEESDEEADLRRALLMPLMENTWAKDSLKREVLGKAILASAIAQIAATRAAALGNAPTQQKAEGVAQRPH